MYSLYVYTWEHCVEVRGQEGWEIVPSFRHVGVINRIQAIKVGRKHRYHPAGLER